MRSGKVPRELLGPARESRLVQYALLDWAAIVAIWLVARWAPGWLYGLWAILIAGRIHGLGVVLHEAVHLAGPKTWRLRVLEVLAGYPIGSSIEAMRYHHLRHHRDNGLPEDPYFKPWIGASAVRFWVMSLRYFLLIPLWVVRGAYGSAAYYVPGLRNSYGRLFLQDRSGEDLKGNREVVQCAGEDRWQLLFHIVLGWVGVMGWPWFGWNFLIPAVLGGYLGGYRLLVEHVQEPNRDRGFETTIRSTRDHHLGWVGAVLLAPHNVGYHRVHHLHPQAGFENLPRLREWYLANLPGVYPS